MTAVAGILNKQGVAIAADSAVTVSDMNNRKVYNSANKIFTLSKYHPVGIAIYNSAEFMGIPWEVIIKEYRKKIGNNSFDTLQDYRDDFFRWLKESDYFSQEWNEESHLYSDFLNFVQVIINDSIKTNADRDKLQEKLIGYCERYLSQSIPRQQKLESFTAFSAKELEEKIVHLAPQICDVIEKNFAIDLQEKLLGSHLAKAYAAYLKHEQFLQFTGLVFTGYGDKELFPRLLPVKVSMVLDGSLRYIYDSKQEAIITSERDSMIMPFAQTDVIQTILQGISPDLFVLSANIFHSFLTDFVSKIRQTDGIPSNFSEGLGSLNLNSYVESYQKQFFEIIREKHIDKLMSAVSHLSKEDLAEMAESLVYLTYLKRRFTMAEESVGGPVDIAVITKGDGFIWIKRKHYFDPELNKTFFQKYF